MSLLGARSGASVATVEPAANRGILAAARPRVLLYADKLSRQAPTGIGQYIAGLAAALDALVEEAPCDLLLCSARERQPATVRPEHIPLVRLPGQRKLVQLGWCTLGEPRLERFLARPDLVHMLAPSVPVPTRAPLVVTVHDLTPLQFPHFYGRAARWAFRRALDQAVGQAERIIAVSQRVAADLRDLCGVGPERVRVVYSGIAPRFARAVPAEARAAVCARYEVEPGRFFLYVGTITARKNLVPLLQAYAAARPAVGVPLVLAGAPGLGAEQVLAEVARLRLESAVRVAGYVPAEDLPALLASALALVHPSIYEGFGFTPLEAMASDTPVAASRGGSLPEVVGEAGLLVEPENVAAWQEALLRLALDSGLRQTLRAAGRVRARQFTWERAARATLAVYGEVLGLAERGEP